MYVISASNTMHFVLFYFIFATEMGEGKVGETEGKGWEGKGWERESKYW